jgi:hypothetical protein
MQQEMAPSAKYVSLRRKMFLFKFRESKFSVKSGKINEQKKCIKRQSGKEATEGK